MEVALAIRLVPLQHVFSDGSSGAMPKNIENKVTWISKNFYRTESKSQQLLVLALASFLFCSRSYEKFFCIHKEFVTGKQVWKFRENVQQTHDQKVSKIANHVVDVIIISSC